LTILFNKKIATEITERAAVHQPHRAAGRCASHTELYGERQVYSTAPTSPEGQKRPHIWSRKQGPSLLPQTLNLETLLTLSFLLLLLSPHLSTFTYSYFCSAQSISPLGPHPNPGQPHALRRRLAASDRIGGARASRVDGGGLFEVSAPASCDPFARRFAPLWGGWGASFEFLTRVLIGGWFWLQGLPIRLWGWVEIGAPRPRRRRGVGGDCR